MRVAILGSGDHQPHYSVMRAINDRPNTSLQIGCVIADRPCGLLESAQKFGSPWSQYDATESPELVTARLLSIKANHQIDSFWICGLRSAVPTALLQQTDLAGCVFCVHPTLTQDEPITDHHQSVLDQGLLVHGVTLHTVDVDPERQRIIAQAWQPVMSSSDVDTLARLSQEMQADLLVRSLLSLARLSAGGPPLGGIEVFGTTSSVAPWRASCVRPGLIPQSM